MKKMAFCVVLCFVVSMAFAQTATMPNGGEFRIMEVREFESTNMFIQPREGMRFVALDIMIDNTKGTRNLKLSVFTSMIEARDPQGYLYTVLSLGDDMVQPRMDPNALIEKGDIMRGWTIISIKKDTPINTLRIRLNATKDQSNWMELKH